MTELSWFRAIGEFVLQIGALGILAYYFLRVQPEMLNQWMKVADRNTEALMDLNGSINRVEESQNKRDAMLGKMESTLDKLVARCGSQNGPTIKA